MRGSNLQTQPERMNVSSAMQKVETEVSGTMMWGADQNRGNNNEKENKSSTLHSFHSEAEYQTKKTNMRLWGEHCVQLYPEHEPWEGGRESMGVREADGGMWGRTEKRNERDCCVAFIIWGGWLKMVGTLLRIKEVMVNWQMVWCLWSQRIHFWHSSGGWYSYENLILHIFYSSILFCQYGK